MVRRLTPTIRDARCSFDQSLATLREAKRLRPDVRTKSSLMLGLGETADEVREAMAELREAGVDVVTLGQYLQPTPKHAPVEEYVSPEAFDALADDARAMGFLYVAAGPLVRSSYRAAELFLEGQLRRERETIDHLCRD